MIKKWWTAFIGYHKDDTGFLGRQGTARFTSTFVWIARVSFLALLVTLFFLGLLLYWSIKGYNYYEIMNSGDIIANEYTSQGIPVVREGDKVSYPVEFKNTGIDTTSIREAKIFGNIATGLIQEPIAAFSLANISFFNDEPTQQETLVEVGLPANLPENSYYTIHTTTEYKPNPIRVVGVESETEKFLYLSSDAEIP